MANNKISRVFAAFMREERHTRFTAERELHDHCLNSTVSDIQKRYGIRLRRRRIIIPGYKGNPTNCCQYWLEREEIVRYRNEIKKAPDTSDQTNEEGSHND